MKVYFNRRPVQGPWGGGSKIISSIIDECLKRRHKILFEEQLNSCSDIDTIICFDPRPNQHINFQNLLDYRQKFGAKIIQRIGDLGTHGKPELFEALKKTTPYSDVLIFPSDWAKNYLNQNNKSQYVIRNAAAQEFINYKDYYKSFDGIINLVTHHWSDNSNKGFDLYQKLDDYCLASKKYTFTYIGRKPANIVLSKHLPPLDVNGLINELPNYHVYITASKLEAGANHVLEAMAMNLPVLYHADGGSINE